MRKNFPKRMKMSLITVFLAMFLSSCYTSYRHNSIGMGQTDKLYLTLPNEAEAAFLNEIFKVTRNNFDFTNKKIGFIKIGGEMGKSLYFDMQNKHFDNDSYPCDDGTLYVFNAAQKIESGGYDALYIGANLLYQ